MKSEKEVAHAPQLQDDDVGTRTLKGYLRTAAEYTVKAAAFFVPSSLLALGWLAITKTNDALNQWLPQNNITITQGNSHNVDNGTCSITYQGQNNFELLQQNAGDGNTPLKSLFSTVSGGWFSSTGTNNPCNDGIRVHVDSISNGVAVVTPYLQNTNLATEWGLAAAGAIAGGALALTFLLRRIFRDEDNKHWERQKLKEKHEKNRAKEEMADAHSWPENG